MKKNNRKGFTIVELVIVIAVIAILAGVLIPTFAGVVSKANKSAREQEVAAALKAMLVEEDAEFDSAYTYTFYITKDDKVYSYVYDATKGNVGAENDAPTAIELDADDFFYNKSGSFSAVGSVVTDADDNKAKVEKVADLGNVVVVKSK